ncbi:MAG: Lin1244/Lin1753 domain-containing protein [Bacteroidota bacterium]
MALGRKEKNTVDYFPFLCKEGKSMFYIEKKYGNDGYATWFKILRQLAVNENHWLNLNDPTALMYLSSKCGVSEDILVNIINDLCKLGEFNSSLWFENKVLFNEKFIDSIQEAYKKRNNKCINLDTLFEILDTLSIRKLNKSNLKVPENTQIRLDKIIQEEIKSDNIKEENILFEKETKFDFKKKLLDYGFDSQLVNDWLIVRKNKKASNTETAFKMFIDEIEKDLTVDKNYVLKICCEKSWKGFKQEWLKNLENPYGKQSNNKDREQRSGEVRSLNELSSKVLDGLASQNGDGSV